MKTKQSLGLLAVMVAVSGITAMGTYKVMEKQTVRDLADSFVLQNDSNSRLVQFSPVANRTSVTDNDFTQAAEKTVNAVVGVKNVQMVQPQYQSMDPFFDFFFEAIKVVFCFFGKFYCAHILEILLYVIYKLSYSFSFHLHADLIEDHSCR